MFKRNAIGFKGTTELCAATTQQVEFFTFSLVSFFFSQCNWTEHKCTTTQSEKRKLSKVKQQSALCIYQVELEKERKREDEEEKVCPPPSKHVIELNRWIVCNFEIVCARNNGS